MRQGDGVLPSRSLHGDRIQLLALEVLDDLIADEEMTSIVEVEPVFEDEFVEPLSGDHPENIYDVDAGVESGFFASLYVLSS